MHLVQKVCAFPLWCPRRNCHFLMIFSFLWWSFVLISGGSRISQTGGAKSWVWDKNLLFRKIFAENCMKMKEIGPGGLCIPSPPPPGSTNVNSFYKASDIKDFGQHLSILSFLTSFLAVHLISLLDGFVWFLIKKWMTRWLPLCCNVVKRVITIITIQWELSVSGVKWSNKVNM